jgi:hypothetical protein
MKNGAAIAFALALLPLGCAAKSCNGEKVGERGDKGAFPAASTTIAAAAGPAGATGAPVPGSKPGRVVVTLQDRLEAEKEQRATDTPKAEEVLAALEKAGLTLTDKKQHVASVYGAMYCLGAKSEGGIGYSVCEYASPEAAKSGRDASEKAFATVANRELATNKKTVLTILQPASKTPQSQDAAKKSFDVFAKL